MNIDKIKKLGRDLEILVRQRQAVEVGHKERAQKLLEKSYPAFLGLCTISSVAIVGMASFLVVPMGAGVAYASYRMIEAGLSFKASRSLNKQIDVKLEELKGEYVVLANNFLSLSNKENAAQMIKNQIASLKDMFFDSLEEVEKLEELAKVKIFSITPAEPTKIKGPTLSEDDLLSLEAYASTAAAIARKLKSYSDGRLVHVLQGFAYQKKLEHRNIDLPGERFKRLDAIIDTLDKESVVKFLPIYKKYASELSYNTQLGLLIAKYGELSPAEVTNYDIVYANMDRLSIEDQREFKNIVEIIIPQLNTLSAHLEQLQDISIAVNIESSRQQVEDKIQGFVSVIETSMKKDSKILKAMTA